MPQATSFDSLLAQCRDLVCERLVLALTGMLDKADGALSALVSEARDPQTQKLYTVTRNKVLAQRETIVTQFRLRYLHEFQQRGNRVKKIGDSFAEIDLSSLELELVAEDDLNETLRFNAMADKLREYCDEELIALDQRAGVLLGDANLQAEDNPFTPQAICDAYKRTCLQIDSNVDVRMVLLKLFDDYVLDEIRAIYKAVNAVLVENSILPKIRSVGPRRQERGKAPPAAAQPPAEKPESAAPAGDRAPGGEQDFFSVLQSLVASNLKAMTQTGAAGGTGVLAQGAPIPGYPPVAGMRGAEGGHAVLQGADLLQSLTRIQLGDVGAVTDGSLPRAPATGEPDTTNVLRELKGTSLGAGMNQMDSMTLDIVALLFDQLFDDPKIPIGVKGLIGRLQIPMLKVAIADKTFFSKKTHPARQMLDTLGELSSRLPADVNASNPLFGRIETILQDLSDGFEDNVEIFVVMRERLQTLITDEDQRVEQETRSAETQMEQKESLALAKTVAQAEIKVRIRDRKVPSPVIEFLAQQWIKLLLVVQVKDGEDSDAWRNALETMDLLILSVEPKDTHEERHKLVTIVPDLLKRLIDGLTVAGVEDTVRLGFFAELRKLHSEVIGRTERPAAPAPLEPTTANETAVADLTPVDVLPVGQTPVDVPPVDMPRIDLVSVEVPVADLTPVDVPPIDVPSVDPTSVEAPRVDRTPVDLIPVDLTPVDVPPLDLSPFDLTPVDQTPVDVPRDDLPPPDLTPLRPLEAPTVDLPPVDLPPVDVPPIDPTPFDLTPVDLTPLTPFDLPPVDMPPVAEPARAPKEAVRPDPTPPAKPRAPTPPVKPPAPTPPAKSPASAPPVKQPARSETRAANPAPLDFTAAVTVNNPFGQGEVQVDDLDFTTQLGGGTARGKRDAGHAILPENLTIGSWVAIRTKGEKDTLSLAKLSYVSQLKSRYLFVDRHGKTTLECSRAELARRFQLGELVITKEVSEPPLFDRLAAGLVGKLGGSKAPR